MSDPNAQHHGDQPERPEDDALDAILPAAEEGDGGAAHRPASVRLREGAQGGEQAIDDMHAANESLAAAFRAMFRVLQLAILALVVIYALSGFGSVNAGERGIRVVFGQPSGEDVAPGFAWTPPYPIGRLVRVETGQRTVQIEEKFWFSVREDDRNQPIEQLARSASRSLIPGRDGSLITSDQNLVHTQWTVVYRRENPRRFVESVSPGHEERIVRAAVRRGVVRAVATTPIDDLMRQSAGVGGAAARAQRVAQETLDALDAGVVIESLVMRQRTPPLSVWQAFNDVQAAESKAQTERVEAKSYAQNQLTRVAGPAAGPILEQIDRYQEAVELGRPLERDAVLATINGLLAGQPVELDGDLVALPVSGEVTEILNQAEQDRVEIAQSAQQALTIYREKLPLYRATPDLVVRRDWLSMFQRFTARDSVEMLLVPPGPMRVQLNPDPDIRRRIEEAERERFNLEAAERRERRQREEQFRTDTDIRRGGG